MLRIDAHQHFWQFDPVRDGWIDESMAVIQKDFMPDNLAPLLAANGIDGCVAVQASQSMQETHFLLKLAGENDIVKGVVGWIDLRVKTINETLQELSSCKKLKGFRHVVQGEQDRAFLLQPNILRGIKTLGQHGYTYDILIHHDQLKFVPEFLRECPDQKFVIDHLAKPLVRQRAISQWAKELRVAAAFENVYCKVSGLVTEADWKNWKQSDFTPYLDVVLEAFGANRLLFGSDWPVCLVAASYSQVIALVETHFSPLSNEEKQNIFGGNACRFYNLT